MMQAVQAFGLQRSGTNYLHWILANDFPVKVTTGGGWKHGFPWEQRNGLHGAERIPTTIAARLVKRRIQPVVIRKDLDHWLASLARNPKDYRRGADKICDTPEEAWHRWHDEWAPLAPIVRYEDFLEDFPATLHHLGDLIGVAPKKINQPQRVTNSPRWRPIDRERYL